MKKQEKEPFLDRVLLHSKNADERLFDMVLRFFTFVILIIIVWIYADLVNVKADGVNGATLGEIYQIDFSKLPVSTTTSLLWRSDEYPILLDEYTDIAFNSNWHPPYQATGYVTNRQVPSELYMDNCYTWYCYAGSQLNGWYVFCIPKDTIDNGIAIWTRNGFYAKQPFTFYCGSVWNDNQTYPLSSFTFDNSTVHDLSVDQYCTTANAYFSNCPLWSGGYFVGANIDYDSVIEDIENPEFEQTESGIFNCNYFLYGDIIKQPWEESEPEESNLNHLFFKDVQIGLTSIASRQNINSSSCVIGIDVDPWVKNNPNEFDCIVQYTWSGKTTSDISFDYTTPIQQMPVKTFINDVYIYSVMQTMIDSGFADSYAYQQINYYYDVISTTTYNGLFPSLTSNQIKKVISAYEAKDKTNETQYKLKEFNLDVSIKLVCQGGSSDPFVKRFDFLHGTESILNSDGLRNNNPWEGESDPNNPNNTDPNVPSGGNSEDGGATAIAYGGNVNVTINNNNKLVSNGADGNDTESIIDKYNEVFGTFKSSFGELATVGTSQGNNGFLGFLSSTYSFIPGLNYIVICVGVVFSLIIILVVIRALLF